jgi:hypothetical protein
VRSTLTTFTKHTIGRFASHLNEAALDDVADAQFAPQMPEESKEQQQLAQIPPQAFHQAGIGGLQRLPNLRKAASACTRLSAR